MIFKNILFLIFYFHLLLAKNITFFADYLRRYGYLNQNNNRSGNELQDISSAIILFQELNGLEISGKITNETEEFMTRPRCSIPDIIENYRFGKFSWEKTNLKWAFEYPTTMEQFVAKRAFQTWEKYTNLNFEYTKNLTEADIVISYRSYEHKDLRGNVCSTKFDGLGAIVGHAQLPVRPNQRLEIHLDSSENWNVAMYPPTQSMQTSFFITLLHEIGHSLGMAHSYDKDAIMNAYLKETNTNYLNFELPQDDIYGIQAIYGVKRITTSTTTTTTTNPPTTTTTATTITKKSYSTTKKTDRQFPDLCKITKLYTFLVVKDRLYIFYKIFFWSIPLKLDTNDFKYYSSPEIITDWLPFLASNTKKVDHIYQKPNDDIVLFVENTVYVISYPSLQLKSKHRFEKVFKYKIKPQDMNAIVNSYDGKTFIFFRKTVVSYVNDSSSNVFTLNDINYIDKIFPGLPNNIISAFRYINGYLYLFTKTHFYEYDPFLNKVNRSDKLKGIELFDIVCPKNSILKSLYTLITKLYIQDNKSNLIENNIEEEEEGDQIQSSNLSITDVFEKNFEL